MDQRSIAPWPANFDWKTRGISMIGRGSHWGSCGSELEVIPCEIVGLLPPGLAALIGVLDDYAHARRHHALANLAKAPDARVVHIDDGADAFGRGEAQHGHALRSWDCV